MVTSTINMFRQIQNSNTNKLEIFRILLLITNSEDFFIFILQIRSLISRRNMLLLWTLKSFRSGAKVKPSQKVVVYIIYTQIIMPKE